MVSDVGGGGDSVSCVCSGGGCVVGGVVGGECVCFVLICGGTGDACAGGAAGDGKNNVKFIGDIFWPII